MIRHRAAARFRRGRWLRAMLTVAVGSGFAPQALAEDLSAIVESIEPSRGDIRALDLLAAGTVIELQAGDKLVLGYLLSCTREVITGGKVTVGSGESSVEGGQVERGRISCDGTVDADSAAGSNEAAVVAIRSLGAGAGEDVRVVPSPQPVFVLAEGDMPADPSLTIERLDRQESPIRVSLFGRALDMKVTGMKLTPGGIYSVACGDRKIAFKIAENAGLSPVVTLQRTIRF
ncbi:MAG TPA: hypothetical protein VG742_19060 [Dongiaceae bacterium]|nr:hypothetical protein [Dongiaceae bacterium]